MYELKKHEGKKSRGYCTEEDFEAFRHLNYPELIEKTNSENACERTAAIRIISEKHCDGVETAEFLCEKLKNEKKLYVKLEICKSLSHGTVETASVMAEYLGKIGENRHEALSEREFRKKSYPLPRDLIARTLAHMKPDIMPVLLEVLNSGDEEKIAEVIDSIGFICFYNDFNNKSTVLKNLRNCFESHYRSDIVRWKLIRAFSSFEEAQVMDILAETARNDEVETIRLEADRSIRIIKKQKKT